ncbi:hypothetical protein E2C01_066370 [Portunus trituberculatus]|uniref:Uncharacterized protein n=1 Tax=Portunus trituberculatus TaxID=210409 RepID=A0A5B7HQ32_PORTR|nr:hypothetical protein [Portunus trituberculatus]
MYDNFCCAALMVVVMVVVQAAKVTRAQQRSFPASKGIVCIHCTSLLKQDWTMCC